jgi:hypothetical protein
MTAWTPEHLAAIGTADELLLASYRPDGTLRRYVTIWVVRVDDQLYIRSANGRDAAWYRHARTTHQGRIRAGGVETDVILVDVEGDVGLTAEIQSEYHRKYDSYGHAVTAGALSAAAQVATYKLLPR